MPHSIDYWKRQGFAFVQHFPGEYSLWVQQTTMRKLRRHVDGSEWVTSERTGEYEKVTDGDDTPQ